MKSSYFSQEDSVSVLIAALRCSGSSDQTATISAKSCVRCSCLAFFVSDNWLVIGTACWGYVTKKSLWGLKEVFEGIFGF
ncbi:MAG: hypothetical protein KAS75_08340 [Planctomycetes bacterium]|nr:hypothetical protein [Planctomycetota bacterium]